MRSRRNAVEPRTTMPSGRVICCGRARRVVEGLEQRERGPGPDLLDRLDDRREVEVLGHLVAVEAHDRDVAARLEPVRAQGAQRTEGHLVGHREHRRGRVGTREQGGHGPLAALDREVPARLEVGLDRESCVDQRVAIADPAVLLRPERRRAAARPEMSPMRSCPRLMRCCTAIRAPATSSIPTDQQPSRSVSMRATGTSASKISLTPSVSVDSEMTRKPSTRRRSLRCDGHAVGLARVADAREQQVEVGALEHLLDAAEHPAEVPAGDVRRDDGDAPRATGRESRRGGGDDVVEPLGHLADPLAGHRVDVGQPAKGARHRGGRHPGLARDVADGHGHGPGSFAGVPGQSKDSARAVQAFTPFPSGHRPVGRRPRVPARPCEFRTSGREPGRAGASPRRPPRGTRAETKPSRYRVPVGCLGALAGSIIASMDDMAIGPDAELTALADVAREYGHHLGSARFAGVEVDPVDRVLTVYRVPDAAFDSELIALLGRRHHRPPGRRAALARRAARRARADVGAAGTPPHHRDLDPPGRLAPRRHRRRTPRPGPRPSSTSWSRVSRSPRAATPSRR